MENSNKPETDADGTRAEEVHHLQVDPFVEQVWREHSLANQWLLKEGNQYRDANEAQIKKNEALKARLTCFAKDSQLDWALVSLWEEVRQYPRFAANPDFHQWNKLEVTEVGESESSKPHDMSIRFTWFTHEGVKYTIKNSDRNALALFENDEEVFGIDTRDNNVTAFKRKGKWATMLVRLRARLKLADEKSAADFRARRAADVGKNFSE